MGGKTAADDGNRSSGGPFCRRVDKRLVRQVMLPPRTPKHWMPMDVTTTEVKIMEVRKFSAEYHELDTKFRKPHLELITSYAVQNPFLFGTFELRKEQLKMQVEGKKGVSVKERMFYYPTTFEQLEQVVRNNFNSVNNIDCDYQSSCQSHVKFYSTSTLANQAFKDGPNPRIMLVARVIIVMCNLLSPNQAQGAASAPPEYPFVKETAVPHNQMPTDTWTDRGKTVFYKLHMNEMYPDHILVYRDVSGPPDARSSRLTDDLKHCFISYRAGTRYNPDEQMFTGKFTKTLEEVLVVSGDEDEPQKPKGPPRQAGSSSKRSQSQLKDDPAPGTLNATEEEAAKKNGNKKKKFTLSSLFQFKNQPISDDHELEAKQTTKEEGSLEEKARLTNDEARNINVTYEGERTGAVPKRLTSPKTVRS